MGLKDFAKGCGKRDCAHARYIGVERGLEWAGFRTCGREIDDVLRFDPGAIAPKMHAIFELSITLDLLGNLAREAVCDWQGPLPDAVKRYTVCDGVSWVRGRGLTRGQKP